MTVTLFFIIPFGGAMIVGIPPLFDKLTGWAVCPCAVSISVEGYNQGPVTTSPTGHQKEWTCTFEDSSQKVVPNEEIAFKGLGTSAAAVGICSSVGILILTLLAAIIGWRIVKPQTV